MKSLRILAIGAALIAGSTALASAQHWDRDDRHDRDHDRHDNDRHFDRDRGRGDHDRDDRRFRRDRDDWRFRGDRGPDDPRFFSAPPYHKRARYYTPQYH